jgi:2-hydroxy-6-oxonona-2,4-dienedioate hydrolase
MKKFLRIIFLIVLTLIIVVGTPYIIPVGQSQNLPSGPFENSETITSEGIDLHFRHYIPEVDSGKPWCLLVHGFSGSTWSWRYTADSLCRSGFHVVSIDIPPYGYSDRNPRVNGSMTARSEMLYRFSEQFFPGKKWHLIGHSMGGGIVEAMALMYPENIVSVTFVAGALFSELNVASKKMSLVLLLSPFERWMIILGEQLFITEKQVKKLLESAYGTVPSDEDAKGYFDALNVPGTVKGIIRTMTHSYEIADLSATELKKPVLAIWGDKDTWVPLEYSQNCLDEMSNVSVKIINGAGHCPMETHQREFMAHLLNFLNQF